MRFRARVDNNQKEIVAGLRAAGRSVIHTHQLGNGMSDLIVSNGDEIWLMEVKNPDMKGSAREYTPAELKFREQWRGKPIITVYTLEEALKITSARF